MKKVTEIIEEVKKSLDEMEESLKDFSAKRLMLQRELKKIDNEEENVRANIALYHGILDDLAKRREKEIQVETKGEEKPVKEKKIGATTPKKLVAVDEKNETIAVYPSIEKAAKDLKLAQPTVSYRIRIPAEKQIQKFGFALLIA